jgi:hypothetical protein
MTPTPGQTLPRGQTFQASATWVGVAPNVNETLTAVTLKLVSPTGVETDLTSQVATTRDAVAHSVTGAVTVTIAADAELGSTHLHWTCTPTGGGGIAGSWHEWYIARLP